MKTTASFLAAITALLLANASAHAGVIEVQWDSSGRFEKTTSVEPGKFADLVVLAENPLANLKVLYGTGHARLGPDGTLQQVGGVRWTIRGGIVYDAPALLADVRRIVAEAKKD